MIDRSISEVLRDIVGNIQDIVRSEVRLAKTEVREEIVKAKAATVITAAGGVCAVFASFFVLLATVYGLTRVMPDWAAALTIAAALAIAAGVMLGSGLKQFGHVKPVPERTMESVKENVEWVKQQTK